MKLWYHSDQRIKYFHKKGIMVNCRRIAKRLDIKGTEIFSMGTWKLLSASPLAPSRMGSETRWEQVKEKVGKQRPQIKKKKKKHLVTL